jgi:hypothetical protein
MGGTCRLALLAGVVVLAAAGGASARQRTPAACAPPRASAGYTAQTLAAIRAHTDLWGNRLLAAPGGPTYAGAARYLKPLLFARGPRGTPLTASGVYYLPFAQPDGARGAGSVALHIADGSQILAQHVGGRSLTVWVGDGRERYGSCLARLGTPALADGYLPILETRYTDAAGAHYAQESFAARVPETGPLVSFVRVSVDARRATRTVRLRLAPRTISTPRGKTRIVYAAWHKGPARAVTPEAYATARQSVVSYWQNRLSEGAEISVPEPRVEDAERALLVQDLSLTWRYSIGNAYEEFSFPESVEVAQVLAEHGFPLVARSMLTTSLTRKPTPYPNWKKGGRLLAVAEYVRLSGDHAFLQRATPTLRGYVTELGRQISHGGGLLGRERYSSDIPISVYGLHSQAVVWEGLRAIADAWAQDEKPALATASRRLAAKLEGALKRAVRASERRLADGSLFIPVQLLDREKAYASVTQERLGSYWNLVAPYAFASGLFPPGGRDAKGALRYMLLHGSRLLGLVRGGSYALYGRDAPPTMSGTDQVYGNNVARFLADNDQADQLVLSLYGMLAAAMTPRTFVSGEGATVTPLDGSSYRAMYLPPNAASNAAFLETLRLMLVHETPTGLQLAYSTPRAWLLPGKRIAVSRFPTSFGVLSYSLRTSAVAVQASVEVPERARRLALRLRLPRGRRIVAVTLGGRPFRRFDAASSTLDLSGLSGSLDLVARLSAARSSH